MGVTTSRALGKYHLIAEIARGGMGIVYLAMVSGPAGFNKLVVIKELKPELVEDPSFMAMFLDEARVAARLNHPNIVQTNEVGNDGDRHFMAMDYLDGRGLDRILRRSHKTGTGLTLPMYLRLVCEILSGLDYAHKLPDFDGKPLGIVHRDVSPQNVFVTFDGQVKLLDFGIAKAADSRNETRAGQLKGKVGYMAPEQARDGRVDARADIFSAGVILWEGLAGRRMLLGNEQEMLWALASEDLPKPSTVKPWIPKELDDICSRAIAWNRDDRYPTAAKFRDDLEEYIANSGTAVGNRELGACIAELFAEERASMTSVIETHVARARGLPVKDDALPVIEYSIPSLGTETPTPRSGPELREPAAPAAVKVAAAPSAPRAVQQPSPARRRTGLVVGGIVGAVAVAGAATFAMTRGGGKDAAPAAEVAQPTPPPPATATPRPATPEPAPATVERPVPPAPAPAPAPAPPSLVEIDIRVVPPNATITIDGAPVANPFHGSYTPSSTHAIQIAARGFFTKSETLTFASNQRLDYSLERAAAPTPVPAVVAMPRQVTAATVPKPKPPVAETKPEPEPKVETKPDSGVRPTGGTKPRRTIESTNPYGGQ